MSAPKEKIMYIDFGLAKHYETKKGEHVDQEFKREFVGTAEFTSLAAHNGQDQSRRDDLESIGLVLIYLLKGNLPWSNLECETIPEKHKEIRTIMNEISIENLCRECPLSIKQYI